MVYVTAETKEKFQSVLATKFEKKLEGEEACSVKEFAEQYFANASLDDLNGRHVDDVYGAAIAAWRFIQNFDGKAPKIRVFNPDYEKYGWQSTHTIVEILQVDMPFLVDSVRIELNRRELTIHSIQSTVLKVERTDKHDIKKCHSLSKKVPGAREESIIYIEVDRHTNEEDIQALTHSLAETLADVSVTVADFSSMVKLADTLHKDLKNNPPPLLPEEVNEAADFMAWLSNNHFTFLGYEEFKISHKDGCPVLTQQKGTELGILKYKEHVGKIYQINELDPDAQRLLLMPNIVTFRKSANRSKVHRPAYPDYITIKQFNKQGEVVGEHRFIGLYTSSVYVESPREIPILRGKVKSVMERSGFNVQGHNAKELAQILEMLPRDELFQTSTGELFNTAIGISNIRERRMVRLFMRRDPYGRYYSALIYVPRDIFSTEIRLKITDMLSETLGAVDVDQNTYFSESILARAHLIFQVDPAKTADIDINKLETQVKEICRSWKDELHTSLADGFGEEDGNRFMNDYQNAFPASYRESFSSRTAVVDIKHINELTEETTIAMSFYRAIEERGKLLRFKIFHMDEPVPLSDVLPVLEYFGLRVIGEHPYEVIRKDGDHVWIHDFSLVYLLGDEINLDKVKDYFQETFAQIWKGCAESDAFNKLVLGANISWREVAMLRSYARYAKQLRLGFSHTYIAEALCMHSDIARSLVELFKIRFNPEIKIDGSVRAKQSEELEAKVIECLDDVQNLNEDRIIRSYLSIINATIRTNYFQKNDDGQLKPYFSYKIRPSEIPDIPKPVPMFETFVYSPRMEGVHLRGGKVARGGLRWSDREEDYRTEVLGLVKAQQVKNAVIVPVGAKGGFVAKHLDKCPDRESFMKEGIACYKMFIHGLLDLADNLKDGKVIPPEGVIRMDEDDPYLVVAADKGTATFSDIANEISESYGFWLGDAFASGGSQGYDHKKMGITAKGAWVSVQRHFRELGVDVQKDPFTCVAIGDMAGDVFGNGMLCSDKIRLQVAFNHLHIFVDPSPDEAKSFVERKRLFELPRSSWSDYDAKLMSKGGGIFDRSAKSITITPEMKKAFSITADKLNPTELIHQLLKAPVDLIWNGGIGTYVKSATETHTDVGDKANDNLRVNGGDLNCKVVGEGGNLGMTQLGRVEAGLNGVKTNTDFIDNAGGVDCSDHEVNIKILLNDIVASGDMTEKQRNKLLVDMTDEVSVQVLQNNYRQTQAISIAKSQASQRLGEYRRLINQLEADGKLNRELEFIPDEETLIERSAAEQGLTGPEISVLISYCKALLKEELVNSRAASDEYLSKEITTAVPSILVKKYKKQLYSHQLKREIVATQHANALVNQMGMTFLNRLKESTGADSYDVLKAYVVARDIFDCNSMWEKIEALDYKVPAEVQMEMMSDIMRLIRRSSRWFIRNRRCTLNVKAAIDEFSKGVREISGVIPELLTGDPKEKIKERAEHYIKNGVPEELANLVGSCPSLYPALGIIEASVKTKQPVKRVAETYFRLGERLELTYCAHQLNILKVESHWQALARETFLDDLEWQARSLAVAVLTMEGGSKDIDKSIDLWLGSHEMLVGRWRSMLTELRGARQSDFAMFSVAMRELLDLAQSSKHMMVCDI